MKFTNNHIIVSIRGKIHLPPLQLASLVGNDTSRIYIINKYVEACPMPIIKVLPNIEDVQVSEIKSKTLFEIVGFESSLTYMCKHYLDIKNKILSQQEGIVPTRRYCPKRDSRYQ
jgi:light-independent protochlorophyllide reductase subunit L